MDIPQLRVHGSLLKGTLSLLLLVGECYCFGVCEYGRTYLDRYHGTTTTARRNWLPYHGTMIGTCMSFPLYRGKLLPYEVWHGTERKGKDTLSLVTFFFSSSFFALLASSRPSRSPTNEQQRPCHWQVRQLSSRLFFFFGGAHTDTTRLVTAQGTATTTTNLQNHNYLVASQLVRKLGCHSSSIVVDTTRCQGLCRAISVRSDRSWKALRHTLSQFLFPSYALLQ